MALDSSDETIVGKRKLNRRSYIGENNPNYGKRHSDESKQKMSENRKGKTAGEKNPTFGKPRDAEVRRKISEARVERQVAVGERNPNWKGGVYAGSRIEWSSTKYKAWRKTILTNDNYTCQMCGIRGGDLEVDHILPWAWFPEFRYDPANGRTVCRPCHLEIHSDIGAWREHFAQRKTVTPAHDTDDYDEYCCGLA